MRTNAAVGADDVKAVYSGAEGDLWELVMGEQIHIGGLSSSMALCDKAGKLDGLKGVDLCCCSGAGMRFLVRSCKVAAMTGVDFTEKVITRGIERCRQEGLTGRVQFVQRDVCNTGLTTGQADFVWGEDAWCYVEDKGALVAEAARIIKTGGTIAFTDWVEGDSPLTAEESERLLKFMKFPNILNIADYKRLLDCNGCHVNVAEDTRQFASHIDLYINMLTKQLTYDALKIINFDMALMQGMADEMLFMQKLAHEGKLIQGRFVATKK
ncbi:MAG: methyltransferase domain-containing protein [Candidatus Omnitrophica bacterium]|nr:methyltransferase domain-containing protein [Candidatus Omnitrophota bacterium]